MTITSNPASGGIWADAVNPGIRKWHEVGAAGPALVGESLFNIQTSDSADEEVTSVGTVGVDSWDLFEQSGRVPNADFDQGHKKTYTHREYAMELRIRRKTYEDAKYRQIFDAARRLGSSARLKREVDKASVFNNAFSDTFAGSDGVGLCSTAHPNSPQRSSTQSNEGTYALTRDNVGIVRETMMAVTDDTGNKIGIIPNLLLVPPALEDEGLVIAQTMNKPGSADNDINPHAGRFRVQTWHYLTDNNAWFMIDEARMKDYLDWFDRVALDILPKVEDKTIEATWISYMRYSFGFSGWQWLFGNNPS